MLFLILQLLHRDRRDSRDGDGAALLGALLAIGLAGVFFSPFYSWSALREALDGDEFGVRLMLWCVLWCAGLGLLLFSGVGPFVLFSLCVGLTSWGVYEKYRT